MERFKMIAGIIFLTGFVLLFLGFFVNNYTVSIIGAIMLLVVMFGIPIIADVLIVTNPKINQEYQEYRSKVPE